jgi:hypothetical protein
MDRYFTARIRLDSFTMPHPRRHSEVFVSMALRIPAPTLSRRCRRSGCLPGSMMWCWKAPGPRHRQTSEVQRFPLCRRELFIRENAAGVQLSEAQQLILEIRLRRGPSDRRRMPWTVLVRPTASRAAMQFIADHSQAHSGPHNAPPHSHSGKHADLRVTASFDAAAGRFVARAI